MKVCIVQAKAVRSRKGITITRYELRLTGGDLGISPYLRKRANGQNPVILASTLSGRGVPVWMAELERELNMLDPATIESAERYVWQRRIEK